MQHVRIDPMQYPLQSGESWWIVHPNNKECEFRVPAGACTVCLDDLLEFRKRTVYRVVSADNHNGWVTIGGTGGLYDLPQYLFARHFDAESFVVGKIAPEEFENAKPFDYKPTIPKKIEEEFKG